MKVRKAINKVAALGIGVSMVGATLLSAMAADLADYPAPFVTDGQFNAVIVVGDKAAAEDVIGAVDIGTSLQFALGQPVSGPTQPGGAGGVLSVAGDAVQISEPNDLLEIRERIGKVKETLTEFDLAGLQGGTIVTDEGATDYNQYLRFEDVINATSTERIPSCIVVFEEDEDDVVGDYLKCKDGETVFEFEVEFEEGVESEIDFQSGTAGPKELDDLEDEEINMLGTIFSIVDTRIITAGNTSNFQQSPTSVTLELLGGDVLDTLEEGETRTYTIDGKEYEVNVVIISDNADGGEGTVKFNVNGEITDELEDGETDILVDGTQIGIREILPNEAEEETGGDIVEFFLGANKVELTDSNFTDDKFDEGGVEIHEEDIEDADIKIRGNVVSQDVFEIQSMQYRLQADSPRGDVYIAPGHGMREYLDEPEGMLTEAWDIRYEGLTDTGTSILQFDANGDDSYDLIFTNREGLEYDVPYMDNSRDEVSFMKFGDEDNDLVFTEGNINVTGVGALLNVSGRYQDATGLNPSLAGVVHNATGSNCGVCQQNPAGVVNATGNIFNIDEQDWFVLTDEAGATFPEGDETSFTHVLTYESIDTANREVTFNDEGTGQREITYSDSTINGVVGFANTLVVGGNTFNVYVENETVLGNAVSLAVDQNGDQRVDGQEIRVTINGGGIVDLGTENAENYLRGVVADEADKTSYNITQATTSAGAAGFTFNTTLVTLSSEFDGDGVLDTGVSENISITFFPTSPSEMNLDVNTQDLPNSTYTGVAVDEFNTTIVMLKMESLDEEDLDQGLSTYGSFFEKTDQDNVNDADELTIEYPLTQRGADVLVTIGSVQVTRFGSAAGGVPVILSEISVGSAKLASEVAGQETSQNMILVGGPCINPAAATIMGSSTPMCGEESGIEPGTAIIKLFENDGNVAMLVAGYNADDTRRAAKVVAEYENYAAQLTGMEVVVTGTSMSDIEVSAPQ